MAKNEKVDVKNITNEVVKQTGEVLASATNKVKRGFSDSQSKVINIIDQNGNGEIDIEDIIILGLKTPGVRINRTEFLNREFRKHYSEDVIEKAINETPALAGISSDLIDKISNDVIQSERNLVSGISTALGSPGGFAMVATIPTDIIQYYGYLLRAMQKILYLYGFPEINTEMNDTYFDSETMNTLVLCMGVMYGAAGASNALKGIAHALGQGVEKKLLRTALTKGTFYPVVKSTLKWFNVNLTKKIFANFFKKSIPVIGGLVGGGITYLTFKPCCDKLKDTVKDTILSNPNYEKLNDFESLF
ncbi:hypothetical protein [Erysipelothrix rhusiopathiae]|uniref:hypothetical protein n=1 Tax=Erysipelothrix rhusiopathiae TaxID=1648 RepID=UPI002B25315F|nr:hypothetical protein [Erysipelothrix rhusiopathiae]WRB93599.1 hypothetical protein LL063_03165 [Erysipelothrix rhusiopathiae]